MSAIMQSTTKPTAFAETLLYYSLIVELILYLLVGRVVRRYWRLYSPSSVLDVAFGICALVAFAFYKLRVVISIAIFLALSLIHI